MLFVTTTTPVFIAASMYFAVVIPFSTGSRNRRDVASQKGEGEERLNLIEKVAVHGVFPFRVRSERKKAPQAQ